MGLQIIRVVEHIQLHQMTKQVHDCHHYEHSLPLIRLLFVVLLDEWLKAILDPTSQPIFLHFGVIH